MGRRTCRICKGSSPIDQTGRCRLCRETRIAQNMGLSYGKYKAVIYARYGYQEDGVDASVCPACGKFFLPGRATQRYCSPKCARRMATINYRRRKKEG